MLPVSSKLSASTSKSCLGNTATSPKYNVALLPNPTVGSLSPITYAPTVVVEVVTELTVGDNLTSAPLIPVRANKPPPMYLGGAALGPPSMMFVIILKLRATASCGM